MLYFSNMVVSTLKFVFISSKYIGIKKCVGLLLIKVFKSFYVIGNNTFGIFKVLPFLFNSKKRVSIIENLICKKDKV